MVYKLLLINLIIDLIIPLLIAIPYKNYSHTKMVMSVLGCKKSPLAIIYNVWMIISGLSICILGYKIFVNYNENHFGLSITILILLILYGVGDEVISGIFPVNETKAEVTLSSTIHGIASVIGFISLQFAPLFFGILALKNGQNIISITCFASFILSFIAFCFFIMGDKPRFKNTIFSLEGLWQRVICFLIYIPFILWLIEKI